MLSSDAGAGFVCFRVRVELSGGDATGRVAEHRRRASSGVRHPACKFPVNHSVLCNSEGGGKTAISGTYYVHGWGRWAERQVLYTLRSRIALNNRTKEGQVPAGSENGGAGDASDAGRTWIAREGMREDVMVQ